MALAFPSFRFPAFRRNLPRSVQTLNDPASTRNSGNLRNSARVGGLNNEGSVGSGLGAARPGRAGEFEQRRRQNLVERMLNFQPVVR